VRKKKGEKRTDGIAVLRGKGIPCRSRSLEVGGICPMGKVLLVPLKRTGKQEKYKADRNQKGEQFAEEKRCGVGKGDNQPFEGEQRLKSAA